MTEPEQFAAVAEAEPAAVVGLDERLSQHLIARGRLKEVDYARARRL